MDATLSAGTALRRRRGGPAAARAAALALLGLLALATGGRAAEKPRAVRPAAWPLLEAVTVVHLNEADLWRLGLRVSRLVPSAVAPPPHTLSFAPRGAPAFRATRPRALRARVADDDVRSFTGGAAWHAGGFALEGPAGTFDFVGFALRPGARRFSLELLDASGAALLVAAQPWFELDPGTGALRVVNADLRLLPAFARRLGDERLAGATIGVLELSGRLRTGTMPRRPALAKAAAPPPCDDFDTGDVDVALIDMDEVAQSGTEVEGRIVVVPSVTLKNVGTANVPWYTKFTGPFPPYGNDQHPYLVWQMLRLHEGVLEPLGRNDMKHAFASLNVNCAPGACNPPGSFDHILGVGCEDPYNIGSNTWLTALAPRSEVTASTGVWAHCDEPLPNTSSHFDLDGDCVPTYPSENLHTRGMRIDPDELDLPGARYLLEAFYVVRDDVNVLNSMGYLEVDPALSGNTWTFAAVGPFRQGPVLDGWVDRASPPLGSDNRVLDTGEGHVQAALRVTDLPDGRRRFAFAVQNHDFDRRIASFRVPIDTASIAGLGFADGDGEAGNDWQPAVDATGVTWTAPANATPPAELDWGTLYSFRLEAFHALPTGPVTFGVFEAGTPGELQAALVCDGGPCFFDGFESAGTAAWSDTHPPVPP